MSGAPQGPPPFEPPLAVLSSFSTAIQTLISQYENANTTAEKAAALQELQTTSTKLSRLTAPIQQQFMELNFRPNVNVAVRIAVEMGLFNALPLSGEPSTVAELAKKTNAEEEFVLRISRVLGAFDILQESNSSSRLPAYSHTPLSRFLTTPPAQAATRHLFDTMLRGQALSAGEYYLSTASRILKTLRTAPSLSLMAPMTPIFSIS